MKPEKKNTYYTKGKIDERLADKIRYDFEVVDAFYSPEVKKIQVLYKLFHPHTEETYSLLEEYAPESRDLREAMDRTFYPLECSKIKKVNPEDFIGLSFSAELYYHNGQLVIDWETVFPEESAMSEMYEHREKKVLSYAKEEYSCMPFKTSMPRDFLFYTQGVADKRLRTDVEYIFNVEDVQYSDITKTIQFMFNVEHPDTYEKLCFFEEYYPLSQRFKKFLDRLCYIGEKSLSKKVCLSDIERIAFIAKFKHHKDKLCIDLDTAVADISVMSPMFDRYEGLGLIIN